MNTEELAEEIKSLRKQVGRLESWLKTLDKTVTPRIERLERLPREFRQINKRVNQVEAIWTRAGNGEWQLMGVREIRETKS